MGEGRIWRDLLASGQSRLQHVNCGRKLQGPPRQSLPAVGRGRASVLQRRFEPLAGVRQTDPNSWKLQSMFSSGYLCSFGLNAAVASEIREPRFSVDMLVRNLVCSHFFVEHGVVSHGRDLYWIHLPHGTLVSSPGSTVQHHYLAPA